MDFQDEDEVPDLIDALDEPIDLGDKRIPITLICGFLGAGKSTLLRRILTEKHGFRIAVIMNEFGDTADIEAKAIKIASPEDSAGNLEQASEEFLELANGCLCCSIKNSGVAAIEKLMSRKGAFDHILLETTGLADPGPIAAMFWQNEEFAMGLGKDIFLDGVICVVDAVFADKQIGEDAGSEGINHSLRQIAAADVLLLNKSDLCSDLELQRIEALLHQLNPSVPIYRTVRAQIDLSKVMGIGAYSERARAVLEAIPHNLDNETHETCLDHEHSHPSGAQSLPARQHAGISNILVHVPDPLMDSQISALDRWIRTVLWENTTPFDSLTGDLTPDIRKLSLHEPEHVDLEVLRCKGIWWNERGEQFVLQGVRTLYEISKVQGTSEMEESMAGKLVFIGKGLNKRVADSLKMIVTRRIQ